MEQVRPRKHWNWYTEVQVRAENWSASSFHVLQQHSYHTKEIQGHASGKCAQGDAHPSVESGRDPPQSCWSGLLQWPLPTLPLIHKYMQFPYPQHKQARLQGLYSCWISNNHFYPWVANLTSF